MDISWNTLTDFWTVMNDGTINGNNRTITNRLGCYTLDSYHVESSVSLSSNQIYRGNDFHIGNDIY